MKQIFDNSTSKYKTKMKYIINSACINYIYACIWQIYHYMWRKKTIRHNCKVNWINSMQVKKILFTNVFFYWSLCLLNMFPPMVFPKHFYFFRFVDIIVITVHDLMEMYFLGKIGYFLENGGIWMINHHIFKAF
jgi:hypothetical protein